MKERTKEKKGKKSRRRGETRGKKGKRRLPVSVAFFFLFPTSDKGLSPQKRSMPSTPLPGGWWDERWQNTQSRL